MTSIASLLIKGASKPNPVVMLRNNLSSAQHQIKKIGRHQLITFRLHECN